MTQEQFREPSTEAQADLPSALGTSGEARARAAAPSAPAMPAEPKAAALWRALAGMALSLALACVIVAIEFSTQATYRANRIQRRLGTLSLRVRRLKAEVVAGRARLAAARREVGASEALRTVLLAPDLRTIRLVPSRGAGAKQAAAALNTAPSRAPADADGPGALLAFSPKQHRAVLQAAGIGASPHDRVFVLWWRAAHGTVLRAGEFRTAANGSALVALPLPDGFVPAAAMVTAESAGADGSTPQGKALLRGGPGHRG